MYLGIDYGERRVGLALADKETKIVLPFKVLENKNLEQILEDLKKIIAEEKILKIIVGWPLNLKGEPTEKTQEVQEFVDILAKNVEVPVLTFDERLTSRAAKMLSAKKIDVGAAMLILESFLGQEKARGKIYDL
ncbi:MAG: hypothetical protein UT86_C0005G0045 [Candidatus Magasanikbacteria bacterium GW2011_GWC2_40_17]|uniref:Putative pre-16S rRNA nuclease n=1 Tax=Candidatus Magasanikbacteria bacterium GW2011_GWA2_42_32 TaxID=1619039 RepID=A0A0G1CDK5_9BACT|nr:MAG: hypothetical protein UT86_C0005G0045 [Candidatus Magasanikbacteria bacterium GW2011_GWC2_40_17]KKS56781.1 MAG: hypothetical protein UV20_C0006G0064 [Candidatus Magasanikbacteria bacterium GW2011_GWA2_42_32]OGH86074.1 MAG: hypothetical protein A2294_02075 [Candidatus Magasanikbacteria bacterium RIFOXYB2_FULL_38_10]